MYKIQLYVSICWKVGIRPKYQTSINYSFEGFLKKIEVLYKLDFINLIFFLSLMSEIDHFDTEWKNIQNTKLYYICIPFYYKIFCVKSK